MPFPSLRDFALTTSYTQAQDFEMSEAAALFLGKQKGLTVIDLPYFSLSSADAILDSLKSHPNLDYFTAWLPFTAHDTIATFLKTLVGTCPDIRVLTFVPTEGDRGFQHMTFDTIRPVLQLKKLKELEVFDRYAIQIDDDDIRDMGRAWPQIETLNLCTNAYETGSFGIETFEEEEDITAELLGVPISRLLTFATAFPPTLRKLGMCFDFDEDLPGADTLSTRVWSLEVLGVGSAPMPMGRARGVGEFLGVTLKPGSKIAFMQAGPQSAYGAAFEENPVTAGAVVSESWEDVLAMMSTVHRVQEGYGRLMAQGNKGAVAGAKGSN